MTFSGTERQALADLLIAEGPDAPTLCGEWTTHDLAAHLWVRERKPLAALQIAFPVRGKGMENATQLAMSRPYEELVGDWASGPKGLNPWRVLDPIANSVEHFIHHEDVRRGALSPGDPIKQRDLPEDHEKSLYRAVKLIAGRALKADRPVILNPDGLPRVVTNDKPGVSPDGEAVVRVAGTVGEIILWLFGRDVVDLTISGDDSSVKRMNL